MPRTFFRRTIRLVPALLLSTAWLAATGLVVAADTGAKWELASKSSDLTVYARPHKGSALREYKAVGLIAAPPEVVRRVLDDVEAAPRFMPYVTEARVLFRDANSRVSYQRLSLPIVGDRDYTVRVRFETLRTPAGATCFCNRWQTANELGPAEKPGVCRVKITEGSWLLEPVGDGHETRATYCIFSDSGGSLPAFFANAGCKTAIPKVFEAIRKRVQLPKYSTPR